MLEISDKEAVVGEGTTFDIGNNERVMVLEEMDDNGLVELAVMRQLL